MGLIRSLMVLMCLTLVLQLTAAVPWELEVKQHEGSMFINVWSNSTVLYAKQVLRAILRYPPERQRLFFGITEMQNHRTLASYGVRNTSVIRLQLRQN